MIDYDIPSTNKTEQDWQKIESYNNVNAIKQQEAQMQNIAAANLINKPMVTAGSNLNG